MNIDDLDDLYSELAQERQQQAPCPMEQETLRFKTAPSESTLQHLKSFKPHDRHQLEILWDPRSQQFTDDPDDWASILLAEAMNRQGLPRGDDNAGESLLQDWDVDLSSCRTELDDAEVEAIVLCAPQWEGPRMESLLRATKCLLANSRPSSKKLGAAC